MNMNKLVKWIICIKPNIFVVWVNVSELSVFTNQSDSNRRHKNIADENDTQ
jgi:hypothetical protein